MQLINISNKGRVINLFCRDNEGNLQIREVKDFFPYFYSADNEGVYNSYTGVPLRKIIVSNPKAVTENRGKNAYEADVIFTKRYLIDKIDKIEKCPIKVAWMDIEILTDEFPDPNEAKYPISCISIENSFTKKIKTFYLGDIIKEHLVLEEEKQLLQDFIDYMKKEKFDLMVGWNLQKFDFLYLSNRIPDFAKKISPIGQTRYGNGDVFYPAGISIVDYLTLYKLIFKGLSDYSLNNVLKHEFGVGKKYEKVDFSTLNERIKLRNVDDVKGMVKIDEKHKIIDHYNEIRIFTKVGWEDFIYNSRAIDMLLLQEAKIKKVVLPMKPVREEGLKKEKFEQAYREIFEKGRFEKVGKYDLAGAYLNAIIDLNLDTANIMTGYKEAYKNSIPVNVTDRKTQKIIETYSIKQDTNTLLPSIAKKLLNEKNKLKELKNNTNPEKEEYKSIEKKYEAMKALVLSAWGVIGNEHFRCYDIRVASMITSTIRDIIHYVEDELKKRNYSILYLDTDGIICRDNGENITTLLNEIVQKWSQERFGKSSSIKFDYEGRFDVLILLAMCRYKGWLKTEQGKIKVEIKGIEAKRKDSTVFMKKFQTELLNLIKDKEPKKDILNWIKLQIGKIKESPLEEIAFPCRLARKEEDYKNVPIFLRALKNTKNFNKKVGDPYYYIYVKPIGEPEISTEVYIDGEIKEVIKRDVSRKEITETYCMYNTKRIKVLHKKSRMEDVMAFDEENKSHINREQVDWNRMIDRNIYNKIGVIFEAMKWDLSEIIPNTLKNTPKSSIISPTVNNSKSKVCQNTPKKVEKEDKLLQPVENKEVKEDKIEEIKPYYEED